MDKQLKTVEVYNQHVQEYINTFMSFDLYNDTFNDCLALLPENSDVLELGCGPGNVTHYFLQKRTDLNFLGIDLAPEMVKSASLLNPQARFQVADIRNLSSIHNQYDAVVGAFCLPYLSYDDLDNFFPALNALTKDGGIVYLSCMEGEQSQSGFEQTSFTGHNELWIYYHQRDLLKSKFLGHGFEIERFYTKDYPEANGNTTTDLIYMARKKATIVH